MGDLRLGILTCSDSRAEGIKEDDAGRWVVDVCEERGWLVVAYHVCPDDFECITTSVIEMADVDEVDVVLTLGGTGIGPRDTTPEATERVCERMVPGLAEEIRSGIASASPQLMFSRATAGIRGNTLVVNLPGGEEPTAKAFGLIADQLEYASEMIRGREST